MQSLNEIRNEYKNVNKRSHKNILELCQYVCYCYTKICVNMFCFFAIQVFVTMLGGLGFESAQAELASVCGTRPACRSVSKTLQGTSKR